MYQGGRGSVVLLVGLFASAGLAGCLSTDDDERFTLTREVVVDLDERDLAVLDGYFARGDDVDVYQFVTSTLVVGVRESGVSPDDVLVTYEDRDGETRSRPLSEFTAETELSPGDAVRVRDVGVASHAALTYEDEVVAARGRDVPDWWTAGGVPLGFTLEPGARLAYDAKASVDDRVVLSDVSSAEEDVRIERLEAWTGVEHETRLAVSYAEDVDDASADARLPLKWSTSGTLTVPALLHVTAENLSTGESYAAGVEVLPETGATYDAAGTVWVNGTGAVVGVDADEGSVTTEADVIAWLTGYDEDGADEFSCAGKTRADACRPTEFELDEMRLSESMDPWSETVEASPLDEDDLEVVNRMRAFFAEDLRPGDALIVKFRLGEGEVDGDMPVSTQLEWEMRALDYETVDVTAGTFEALKLVERLDLRVEAGEYREGDTILYEGVTLEPQLVETSIWFDRDTFMPLRMDQRSPVDVGELIARVLDGVGDDFWEDAPVDRFEADALEWTTAQTASMELVEFDGDATFSPWPALAFFQGVGGLPMSYLADGMGPSVAPMDPAAEEWEDFDDEDWDDDY